MPEKNAVVTYHRKCSRAWNRWRRWGYIEVLYLVSFSVIPSRCGLSHGESTTTYSKLQDSNDSRKTLYPNHHDEGCNGQTFSLRTLVGLCSALLLYLQSVMRTWTWNAAFAHRSIWCDSCDWQSYSHATSPALSRTCAESGDFCCSESWCQMSMRPRRASDMREAIMIYDYPLTPSKRCEATRKP